MKKRLILLLFLCLLVVCFTSGCGKKSSAETPEDMIKADTEKSLSEFNDYDGIYIFDCHTSHHFKGVLEIKEGKIRITYADVDSSYFSVKEKDGFSGIFEQNNKFYILVDKEYKYIYSCESIENNIVCQTTLDHDMFGYYLNSYYSYNEKRNEPITFVKSDKSYDENVDIFKQETEATVAQNKIESDRIAEEYNRKREQQMRDTETIHYVRETVICPDYEITFDKFDIKKEGTRVGTLTYVDDPEWIGVTLSIKNLGDTERTYFNHYVRIQNSGGEIIDPDYSINYDIWGVQALNSPTLVSQASKQGYIAFSNTNQDNSNLILLVNCGSYNRMEYKFYLK